MATFNCIENTKIKQKEPWNSPGIVVVGGDSSLECHGFESQHQTLDGHFFSLICCKHCIDVCLKRSEINEKEAGDGPFLKQSVIFHKLLKILSEHRDDQIVA